MSTEINWTKVAASAYRAYAASTGNKNYLGNPMPTFDDLPLPIQTAWEAAVHQASEAMAFDDPDDEQRWYGWVRPQDRPEVSAEAGHDVVP